MKPDELDDRLAQLAARPGVYLFKDKRGVAIYVGKAKNLRSRVRSYFQSASSDERFFIARLPSLLGDIETIVTANEKEAAILENSLIKELAPRFNVKLRDDKEYLFLRLGTDHAWPRLDVVRRAERDGARYFGPYHSATAARRTLHLIAKHFQLRTCSDHELVSRRRPCLQYQIKRCPAPCVYDVDREAYAEHVRDVASFLRGRHDELSRDLTRRMADASEELAFERAAVYRDQLRAIAAVKEEQRVVVPDGGDRDVLAWHRVGDLVEICALVVRGGRLAGLTTTSVRGVALPDEELVSAIIAHRYGPRGPEDESPPAPRESVAGDERAPDAPVEAVGDAFQLGDSGRDDVPKEIVVPVEPEGAAGISEWLSELRGKRVEIVVPKRGPRVGLVELAEENARHAFAEKNREGEDIPARLAQMQNVLRLPALPQRIECVDISHLGGKDTVGAVVAVRDGRPDKKRYRSYHVKSVGGDQAHPGGDDYAAMHEVLSRRFRRGKTASASEGDAWALPDLVVVDGGRGQLGVATAAARDLGLDGLPIVALAKEREDAMGEAMVERVYLPGQKNPIPVKKFAGALSILVRARDEAHRFSNHARKKLGQRRRITSSLDGIPGIGPKTQKALLTAFAGPRAIAEATDDELRAAVRLSDKQLRALRAALSGISLDEPAAR